MVDLLPVGPAKFISQIVARGGWLFGSTIRKALARDRLSDFDLILPNPAALYYFKRKARTQLARHLWEIDGFRFHVCPRVDFKFAPMFDVDMLGLSVAGIGIRPLSRIEEQFSYDVEFILAKIRIRRFSIYPAHERSFYYERKLASLLAAGWSEEALQPSDSAPAGRQNRPFGSLRLADLPVAAAPTFSRATLD